MEWVSSNPQAVTLFPSYPICFYKFKKNMQTLAQKKRVKSEKATMNKMAKSVLKERLRKL